MYLILRKLIFILKLFWRDTSNLFGGVKVFVYTGKNDLFSEIQYDKLSLCDVMIQFFYYEIDKMTWETDREIFDKIRDAYGNDMLYYIFNNYPKNTFTLPIIVKLHVPDTNIYLTLNPDFNADPERCEALGSTLDIV